jgi:hypothetical protein
LTGVIPLRRPARSAGGSVDFVPFYRGILIGFGQGNSPELLFQPRIISAIGAMLSFALMSKRKAKQRIVSC